MSHADTIKAIQARHEQDALWFESGLHDPNGYVAMAHKDRGELLERLRALRTGEKMAPVSPDQGEAMIIPVAAFDWLMGAGPDDQGHHFGDGFKTPEKIPAFWWRIVFRRMCGLDGKAAA